MANLLRARCYLAATGSGLPDTIQRPHAGLMYRETVTIENAIIAVSILDCSMQGGALLGNMNASLTSFPEDPVKHETQCQLLLTDPASAASEGDGQTEDTDS